MMLVNKRYIHVSREARIDKGAIVGYKPLRKLKELDLTIGREFLAMSGAIIYAGSSIGSNVMIGHNSIVREENIIGDKFYLWNNSVVDYGCRIGNNVKIHCNVYVAQFTIIEDGVFIAPGVMIANDIHPKCRFSEKCLKGPYIKKGAVVGINSTINPFIVVGERAVIGAGSVVTKDIPDGKFAYGNPARVAGDIADLKCRKGFTQFPYR
jgi:acetyltransferase-like isoleucine patch superfamily enzyme